MAFCDLSLKYHKQVTNVSPACFCHPTVGNFDVSPKYGHKGKGDNVLWNELCHKVQHSESLLKFKRNIKLLL